MRSVAILLAARWVGVAVASEMNFVTVNIKPKEQRCVFEVLEEKDRATYEVFVLSGGALSVRLVVDGPLYMSDKGELDDERALTVFDSVVKSDDRRGFAVPTQVTAIASVSALYRACVVNDVSRGDKVVQLGVSTATVSTDDKGPINLKHERKGQAEDAAEVALLSGRVRELRTALGELREKQEQERRRLVHHRALYDAEYAAMARSSVAETAVYIVCSLFQLVFVRRWFEGKSVTVTGLLGGECA